MIKSKFTKVPGHARLMPIVSFMVGNIEVEGLIDTGAVITVIPEKQIPGPSRLGRRIKVSGYAGSDITWTHHVPITIDSKTMEVEVVSAPDAVFPYIGLDILEKCRLVVENNTYTLEVIK